ncbi:hypothetical protein CERSUDRAFT_122249 [Gelatoporia subvermispora B]|uniref:Uncharacterized protein n=1 Tax=Ceriporiopsis subvermispora (strain B) TaxID=914234 RepID=M2RP10_CERS8|nr:hypothetical protein CERSUDRAFT_122249 [Gelatoporia subvermispora B]
MESDEVVQTSDCEELETLRAAQTLHYWQDTIARLKHARPRRSIAQVEKFQADHDDEHVSPAALGTRPVEHWRDHRSEESPAKRIRNRHRIQAPMDAVYSRSSPKHASSPLLVLSMKENSPASTLPLPTPAQSVTDADVAMVTGSTGSMDRGDEETQDSIESVQQYLLGLEQPKPQSQAFRQTPDLQDDRPSTPTGSLSSDPHHLFTPVRHSEITHSPALLHPASSGIGATETPPFMHSSLALPPSSPLSEPSSPPPRAQGDAMPSTPPSDDVGLSHDAGMATNAESTAGNDALLAQEVARQSGRYSLRTRQPKQLQPYVYDKLTYKRAMRANPDAIIKDPSPSRAARQRSRSHDQPGGPAEIDDEYQGDASGGEDDEEWRRRRRASKSRSISLGIGERKLGPAGSIGLSSSRASSLSGRAPIVYPGILNDTFSSSSSDPSDIDESSTRKSSKRSTGVEGKTRRRIRPKPFPLKVSETGASSPKPSSVIRNSTVYSPRNINSDIDDDHAPAPTWRRRKSSTLDLSPSSSPILGPVFDYPIIPDNDDGARARSHSPSIMELDAKNLSQLDHVVEDHPGGDSVPDYRSDTASEQSRSSASNSSEKQLRKKAKILSRMYPAVHLKKLLDAAKSDARIAAKPRHAEQDVEEERPLLPGQSRVKVRDQTTAAHIAIRGDTESEDSSVSKEQPVDHVAEPIPISSDSNSDVEFVSYSVPRDRCIAVARTTTSDSDDDDDSEQEDDFDDATVERWVSGNPVRSRRSSSRGPVKERDLIDRMLSRTRANRPQNRKRNRQRRLTEWGSHQDKASRIQPLQVVTAGARSMGTGQQSRLPFTRRASSRSIPTHDGGFADSGRDNAESPDEHHIQANPDAKGKSKQRRVTKSATGIGLYTFAAGGSHVTTGRSRHHGFTIDVEAETNNPTPIRHDERSTPPARKHLKHRRIAPPSHPDGTLDQFWVVDDDDAHFPPGSAALPSEDGETVAPRQSMIDLGISRLRPGVAFGAITYVGRGWLHELCSIVDESQHVARPIALTINNIAFNPSMTAQDFISCLELLWEAVHAVFTHATPDTQIDVRQWRTLFHAASQHVSWILQECNLDEITTFQAEIENILSRMKALLDAPTAIAIEEEQACALSLDIRWFTVEISCRMLYLAHRRGVRNGPMTLQVHIELLFSHLWSFGFEELTKPFTSPDQIAPVGDRTISEQLAEKWVCLIHLLDATYSHPIFTDGTRMQLSFWGILIHNLRQNVLRLPDTHWGASELLWRSIFTLSALSQFSAVGLSTTQIRLRDCWPLATLALERIPLIADPDIDKNLTTNGRRKRDGYIRGLLSRCFQLHKTWQWQLDDASSMFGRLLDIFKSRRFGNLYGEESDFPSFLRENNFTLLSELRPTDTAYTIFLKLIVQAALPPGEVSPMVTPKIKKLLALGVPIGSVPFTKATPPSQEDLSMLYNRFSAVAVAIYIEPSNHNVKTRLAHARRYVNFKDTDKETRRACIRGVMHLSIVLQHLQLPLDDLLDWLTEMTNILVDEYREMDQSHSKQLSSAVERNWTILQVHLILGCITRIVKTPHMNVGDESRRYPDVRLLQGPWITRVLQPTTNLTSNPGVRSQFRALMFAFLDAVDEAREKSFASDPAEDSQEDLWKYFEDEMSDPAKETQDKDRSVAEAIDVHILAPVYSSIIRHLNNPGDLHLVNVNDYQEDADQWKWSHFFDLGKESWERLIDSSLRRRVGLCFMSTILRLDQGAYHEYQETFLRVLMESLVSASPRVEHEYLSHLFSSDGLLHPLLQNLPCEAAKGSSKYKLSATDFVAKRMDIISQMFSNLAARLELELHGEMVLTLSNQTCLGYAVTLISTMREIHEELVTHPEAQAKYTSFCRQISNSLSRHATLASHSRIAPLAQWLADITS